MPTRPSSSRATWRRRTSIRAGRPRPELAPGAHQSRRISAAPPAATPLPARSRNGGFEARPSGNAVSLEDEMLKVADNQMDYQAATSLYTRGLGLLKTALGRR